MYDIPKIDIPKIEIPQISTPRPINPQIKWNYQGINRIVIIGNGFDLAHGLPTKYEDFINWYKEQRVQELKHCHLNTSADKLCQFNVRNDFPKTLSYIFSQHSYSLYNFDNIVSDTTYWQHHFSSLFEQMK